MQKRKIFSLLLAVGAILSVQSCRKTADANGPGGVAFDPSKPIEITGFYPDSGGVATPMIIEGQNFGNDTTGLRVYFRDSVGKSVAAGIVSTNGRQIYAYVPSGLTYKRTMDLLVVKKTSSTDASDSIVAESPDKFIYRTQLAVTTVIGQQTTNTPPTTDGELLTCKLSSPFTLCLDNQDNMFICERGAGGGNGFNVNQPRKADGSGAAGGIVKASFTENSVVALKFTGSPVNAPTFSDEEGKEAVYVPIDPGLSFFSLPQSSGYVPRNFRLIPPSTDINSALTDGNWKHCFLVNKKDKNIYTVYYKGQLVRINPRTRKIDILLDRIGKEGGSDAYLAFSPIKGHESELYVCLRHQNSIYRIPDVTTLTEDQKTTYHGDPFAGKAITEGKENGRGWEDGLLANAKFNSPCQLAFTADGKMYIADAVNQCIRMIDTDPNIPDDKKTVTTAIGLPGGAGFKDGGPDIAKFNLPTGVAVNNDGTIIYVADSKNNVIRKLSIQ